MTHLPFLAPLSDYERQADELLVAFRAGEEWALRTFHENFPRLLDDKVSWLPKRISKEEVAATPVSSADARLTLARWYSFRDWEALVAHVAAVTVRESPVFLFESAVETVVNGDLEALEALLRSHPDLMRARSRRITGHDPPEHRATLLHYVAANGVENYRQKTPKNAVEIASALLRAGAEPDALASMYGGECTTMSLLVSSCHPAQAGLQAALVDTLADHGATVEPVGSGNWTSPLMTALVFGYLDTAKALVRRGAQVSNVAAAAGLGLVDETGRMLPSADADSRHRALAMAAILGQTETVRLLLDAGEDPDRFNPEGFHSHGTPLHQAALAGHIGVVKLLVERGARTDIEDTLWEGTPLGWAEHGGQKEVEDFLRGIR